MAVGNVLVGGGSGFIGSQLCQLLKASGYGVTIISRMPGPQRITWSDLNQSGLPEKTTAVVNVAGQNVLNARQFWTDGFKQNVYNSRVVTTSTLTEAINKSATKPKVFITISGVGIYNPDGTVAYTESSPSDTAFDFFSKLVIDWENAAKPSQCRVVTIRSGVVLGRNGGMIKQLYVPFSLGLGGPIGDGHQFLPWIHIEDITRLILFAMQNDKVNGVINGVSPHIITNKQFTKAFAHALHRPALFPIPKFIFNLLLGKERASMITKGQKVFSTRIKDLGFTFTYSDIDKACQEAVHK